MSNKKKDIASSPIRYFRYLHNIIGNHIFILLILNILMGLLDGIGLTLFIPLISLAVDNISTESLGALEFVVEAIKNSGIPMNLTWILTLMVIVFFLKGVFYYLKSLYYIKLRLKVIRTVRFQMVEGLGKTSYSGFTKMDAGRIQNNMVAEAGRFIRSMTSYFQWIQNIILIITYILLAGLTNWKFSLLVILGGIILNFLYKNINKRTAHQAQRLSNVGHRFNKLLIETIENFKYLKATDYFSTFSKNLKNSIKSQEKVQYKIGRLNAIAVSLREPTTVAMVALVIFIQVKLFGGSFAGILLGLLFFQRAMTYLINMENHWNTYLSESAGLSSIQLLMNEFHEFKEVEQAKEEITIKNIELQNVEVQFNEYKALKNINLFIQQNSTVALVGESGAGKTTLANVICGLIEPTSGKLFYDFNKPLNDNLLQSYRKKCGYISQEPVIFNDSIFENVTFWDEETEENLQKFWKVIEMVNLKDFVNSLKDKEKSLTGSRGIVLSGGQKQRISIARELYKEVQLLILDEATSALDSETEEFIQKNIESLHGQCTLIIIAHRLSTIKNADKIVVLNAGEKIAEGKYEELMAENQSFKRMVELQRI